MKKSIIMAVMVLVCLCTNGCTQEKSRKDRSEATAMFESICKLTKEYIEKLKVAPDSADWADIGADFEEKLDKINFSYPPDTDLLLTEGQNDTIHALMKEYVKARRERIHGILHPQVEADSSVVSDSLAANEYAVDTNAGSGDASRSLGN